jgi:hypothetical protein
LTNEGPRLSHYDHDLNIVEYATYRALNMHGGDAPLLKTSRNPASTVSGFGKLDAGQQRIIPILLVLVSI